MNNGGLNYWLKYMYNVTLPTIFHYKKHIFNKSKGSKTSLYISKSDDNCSFGTVNIKWFSRVGAIELAMSSELTWPPVVRMAEWYQPADIWHGALLPKNNVNMQNVNTSKLLITENHGLRSQEEFVGISINVGHID